jgi:hypothetical protein
MTDDPATYFAIVLLGRDDPTAAQSPNQIAARARHVFCDRGDGEAGTRGLGSKAICPWRGSGIWLDTWPPC